MKNNSNKIFAKIIIYHIIFFVTGGVLHAKGAAQEVEYTNKEWVLSVTEFDVSGLPPARQIVGSIITQNMVFNIKPADEKLRSIEEITYYRQAAESKNKTEVAKRISSKQAERDKLIFQGLQDMQYKSAIKKLDAEIAALRKDYEDREIAPPKIAIEPEFKITNNNLDHVFPKPPKPGMEYYFCNEQKADGFITGKITDFHNRYYVQLALWSLYARTYTYTDSVIFSIEDINDGITELSERLVDEITGFKSAGIRVRTIPDNAVIIIANTFAGHGEAQVLNFTPGEVKISVYADNYETLDSTIELNEDQLADVMIELQPTPTSNYTIDVNGGEEASVYEGSGYKGKTPLTLTGPTDHYRDYYILTEDGKIAQTVFSITDQSLLLNPGLAPAEGRTNKARKRYYNALGRFWISLPFTILSLGLYNSYYTDAYRLGSYDVLSQANVFGYMTIGFGVVTAGFLIESFVKLGMYIYEGNRETSPLTAKKKVTVLSSPNEKEIVPGEEEVKKPEEIIEEPDEENTTL
ncbi:MAG: hypothetical protein Ta2G_10250 [Termitinemataceae bacterium]|nr:MAG: hypothetical protein Ta2G_10250 [Termitinemataceae bacterium]